jgi:hypothetical protein
MKTLRMLAALLVLGGVGAGVARAATELQMLQGRFGKYATDDLRRPRSLCVCQNGTSHHGRVGYLAPFQVNQDVSAVCYVMSFDSEGNWILASSCDTFTILAK